MIDSGDPEACALCAEMLLKACEKAGIRKEREETLVLTEENVNAYISWDGFELNPGDRVRVINPAWYREGRILDQGHCTLADDGGQQTLDHRTI